MLLCHLPGFPDDERKLDIVTRLWAEFAETEPHTLRVSPAMKSLVRQGLMSQEELDKQLEPFIWKNGTIPIDWLVKKIARSAEFFPQAVTARELYCTEFPPLDGLEPKDLPQIGRRESKKDEE